MIGCGTFVSSAKPASGAPIDVASTAATNSLFVFMDGCLLDTERCCRAGTGSGAHAEGSRPASRRDQIIESFPRGALAADQLVSTSATRSPPAASALAQC